MGRKPTKCNYELFKIELKKMLIITDESECDNEWYQDLYVAFKESGFDTLQSWAQMWFEGINLDTHPFMLNKKYL